MRSSVKSTSFLYPKKIISLDEFLLSALKVTINLKKPLIWQCHSTVGSKGQLSTHCVFIVIQEWCLCKDKSIFIKTSKLA